MTGTEASVVGKIVQRLLKLAGHVVRMKDEILPKRLRT